MNNGMPNVSIVVPTYKAPNTVVKAVKGMLQLSYPGKYEIIVVNDGSPDDTRRKIEQAFGKNPTVKLIHLPSNQGVCKARNRGINASQYGIVINMDQDCIPDKKWLQQMVGGFADEKVGVVSGYDYYGGTSTGFRRELLEKVGGYDEAYHYYREDTDLTFKIMELGYEFKLVKADFSHLHEEAKPRGIGGMIRYVLKRLQYHQNDVLLYKKHPNARTEKFLHIQHGFLVDPMQDFKVATGTWEEKGQFRLSSPRGITFLENKSPLHGLVIVLVGIGYVLAVKLSRLIGSIRFGKLLI